MEQSPGVDGSQSGFDARFEWGPAGVRALSPDVSTVVIVDVLSFSTTVDLAIGRGAAIIPYRWHANAEAFARTIGAAVAAPRGQETASSPWSLSPATMRHLAAGDQLVLPSPNGATLAALAAESGANVVIGCLRNAAAVANFVCRTGGPVAVIAAGERWPSDAGLRPAVEDLLGAGAILSALDRRAPSPEARVAIAAYRGVDVPIGELIAASASGRELIEGGYGDDVALAVEANVSDQVPVLRDGEIRQAE